MANIKIWGIHTQDDRLFLDNLKRRIIVATFSSNIHRIQQIIDEAVKCGRKVAISGRSMVNVSDMAIKIGELRCNKDLIIDIEKIDEMIDRKKKLLCEADI